MPSIYHMLADKWEPIGIYLHLSMTTLKAIAAEHQHDPHKCLIGMLEVWLNHLLPGLPSLRLWSFCMGEEQLAREFKEKYILPTD